MTVRWWCLQAALVAALAAGLAACNAAEFAMPAAESDAAPVLEAPVEEIAASEALEEAEEPTEAGDHDVHWTYEGEEGPEHWGALSPKFSACGSGTAQSPIDIAGAAEADLANIAFDYKPSAITISNNGHTVQVDYDSGSAIAIDGVRYDLKQFHFHAPSEHAIGSELAAAELHLVHSRPLENGAVERAVVGVLIEAGAEHPAFASVWAGLPTEVMKPHVVDGQVMAADMLPADQTTVRYDGSLTTPPCDEGIRWNVMTTPIEMSVEQIEAFSAALGGNANNRPVQPLGDRTLVEDATP